MTPNYYRHVENGSSPQFACGDIKSTWNKDSCYYDCSVELYELAHPEKEPTKLYATLKIDEAADLVMN